MDATNDKGLPPGVLRRLKAKVMDAGDYATVSARSGVPLGTLQKMMRGASEPRFSTVMELARTLGVSLDYLVTGIEPDGESGDWESPLGPTPIGEKRVPIRDVSASAGYGIEALNDAPRGWVTFPLEMLMRFGNPDLLDILTVEGDSMIPELHDSDLAMIDRSQTNVTDGLFVLLVDERLFLKRVVVRGRNKVDLVSSNPAYPPFEVTIPDEQDDFHQDGATIVGRVVWVGRAL